MQHPTGGVVAELNVRDGDQVKLGDVVIKLDDTQTRANLQIVAKGLDELMARAAREEAELEGVEGSCSPKTSRRARTIRKLRRIISGERKLLETRRSRAKASRHS